MVRDITRASLRMYYGAATPPLRAAVLTAGRG